MMSVVRKIKPALFECFMLLAAVLYIFPVFILLMNSLKTNNEYLVDPYSFPKQIVLDNFTKAIDIINYWQSAFNTLIITFCVVACIVCFSAMAAYAIVKRSDRITNAVYFFMMGGLLIPFQVYMIPLVKLLTQMGISRTPLALILTLVAQNTPLSVFLYSGYLKSIPNEMEEAARIDGCGPYRLFFSVIVPVLKPCISMVVIFFSLNAWNSFVQPLVIIGNTKFKMLFVQISMLMSTPYTQRWNLNFAACILAMLPIFLLYIIMQNKIISGLTSGAVKG